MGFLPLQLLGGGEFWRSRALYADISMLGSYRNGDAEVSKQRLFEIVSMQENVVRCHVAVNKPISMYRVECKENASHDHRGFLFIEQLLL